MIIRQEQLDALAAVRLPEFEHYMLKRLQAYTPLHWKNLGEEGIRPIIRLGIERAHTYGLTHRNTVQFHIELIFLLGVDFDTDPQYPWAGEILKDKTILDQTQRADRLHERVMAFLENVGGPGREYARRALARTRELTGIPTLSNAAPLELQLLDRMGDAYPEKLAYVGEGPLRLLIGRAVSEAQSYCVPNAPAFALFAGLMFALGHGVLRDPKYPFIDSTLQNTAISDPNKRVLRVHSKMMTYLDHMMSQV